MHLDAINAMNSFKITLQATLKTYTISKINGLAQL